MNNIIHKILELCDSEELNLTHFSYIGSTITIELQVDDRAKDTCERNEVDSIKKAFDDASGMPNFMCDVKIKKIAYVKVEDIKYNCECGQELLQNDKECPFCKRNIDSEEWEWAIRDKATFKEVR